MDTLHRKNLVGPFDQILAYRIVSARFDARRGGFNARIALENPLCRGAAEARKAANKKDTQAFRSDYVKGQLPLKWIIIHFADNWE